MKKIKSSILLCVLACATAYAGEKAGNGGDAYIINSVAYSLDLVEEGIELSPYFEFKDSKTADPKTLKILEKKFKLESQFPIYAYDTYPIFSRDTIDFHTTFANKMSELLKRYPVYYHMILHALEYYRFKWVNAELRDINDIITNLKIDSSKIKQAAIRFENSISINRATWHYMDVKNRIALIFHELNFAIQNPDVAHYYQYTLQYRDTNECLNYVMNPSLTEVLVTQNSDRARKLTGAIFNQDLIESEEDMTELLNDSVLGYKDIHSKLNQNYYYGFDKQGLTTHSSFEDYHLELKVIPQMAFVTKKMSEWFPATYTCQFADQPQTYPVELPGNTMLSFIVKSN